MRLSIATATLLSNATIHMKSEKKRKKENKWNRSRLLPGHLLHRHKLININIISVARQYSI